MCGHGVLVAMSWTAMEACCLLNLLIAHRFRFRESAVNVQRANSAAMCGGVHLVVEGESVYVVCSGVIVLSVFASSLAVLAPQLAAIMSFWLGRGFGCKAGWQSSHCF